MNYFFCVYEYRKQLEEREEAQARVEILDRKMKEYFAQFGSMLCLETLTGNVPRGEEVVRKVRRLFTMLIIRENKKVLINSLNIIPICLNLFFRYHTNMS